LSISGDSSLSSVIKVMNFEKEIIQIGSISSHEFLKEEKLVWLY
jgi:hypothetical protein